MAKIHSAFALIELMVVVAIITILAAIAVPFYKDYLVRTKVSQALVTLNTQVAPLIEYYNKHGEFPLYYNTKIYTPSDPADPIEYLYAWNGCSPAYMGACLQIVATLRDGVIPSPDGIVPSNAPGVGNDVLVILFGDVNGVTKIYCGTDARPWMSTPQKYIPSNCIYNLYDTVFPPGIP